MEAKITALGGILGWVIGLITGNVIGAIVLAFGTGAAAYAGQLLMKYAHQWCKTKIKSIKIKFNSPKK